MRKLATAITLLAALAITTACEHHDDFEFTGTVVGYEYCESTIQDFAYMIALDSPEGIGERVAVADGTIYDNVVVAYQAPRILKDKWKVSGEMYIDNNYSKAHCSRTYDCPDPDGGEERIVLPKTVFTNLKVLN